MKNAKFKGNYLNFMYTPDYFITGNMLWVDLLKSGDRLHEIYSKMRKVIYNKDFKKYHAEIIGNIEFEKNLLQKIIDRLQSQEKVIPVIKPAKVEYFSQDASKRLDDADWI